MRVSICFSIRSIRSYIILSFSSFVIAHGIEGSLVPKSTPRAPFPLELIFGILLSVYLVYYRFLLRFSYKYTKMLMLKFGQTDDDNQIGSSTLEFVFNYTDTSFDLQQKKIVSRCQISSDENPLMLKLTI